MLRFLRQNLLYSLILLLAVSCKTYQLTDAKPTGTTEKMVENLYFSSKEDYVYKCQMDIYSNHVSGILIIKKLNETTHRVVLTSDFGNKLIDFEISDSDFKLNYVLPDLDKKIVINFLKNDFQQLLKRQYPVSESFENENATIYLSKIDRKNYYLFFNKENGLLKQIIYTKNNKEKIDFTFDAKKHIFADSLRLQHKDFKINIKLFQITETE
ncbi:hypothetical protein C1637_00190 [Chryseobacterium lactis]|uniref:DUF4292 domain-containing protein n=1 Tax=Chryseobacterium lactis TaxID=1241981 RepID=A0A3G6RWU5_CHRLC|nr:hypothetical protein [Chryseobacterium lactis]AZA81039.1 hypothetical protein EG342_03575 [Chryseobacterium lactis]AZB06040.1 hypothetical protein EG341_19700 [Chryseobacterium lactis]PNW14889.1 hypothetical protein C1637_00190 [Chryseobacterium lactis]